VVVCSTNTCQHTGTAVLAACYIQGTPPGSDFECFVLLTQPARSLFMYGTVLTPLSSHSSHLSEPLHARPVLSLTFILDAAHHSCGSVW